MQNCKKSPDDQDPGQYGWGLDGYGRAHLCIEPSNKIVFCGLPGVSGRELIYEYIDKKRGQD